MDALLCRVSDQQLARIRVDERRAYWLLTSHGPVISKPWRMLDLDRCWDALDKLLTAGATSGPLANVVHGVDGIEIGPSMSFGRPRYLSPAQVAECADALANAPESLLRDRYASGTIRGAHGGWGPRSVAGETGYLAKMDAQTDREEIDELVELVHDVTVFYAKAKRRGDGMLMTVV